MDNKQKALIVVLVAVVLLFVVAVVMQAGGEEGDASTASADRDGLLGSLGGDPAAVRLGELGGDCQRQGTTLIVEGSCDLAVLPSGERMRLVRLRTQDGIDITAPAPEEADFDIEKELSEDDPEDDEVAIAVDKDGAEIDLDCGLGQTCTLALIGADQ